MISLRRALLWLVLAVPAALMIQNLVGGGALPKDLLHPSGEMSVRLMILALLPGPLSDFFGPNRFLRGWLSIRRNLGVAAFAYALLRLLFYILDVRLLWAMIQELSEPAIWTGWVAFAALAVPAAISFDRAVRQLGRRWKKLQRLAYMAFFLALVHWVLLDWAWAPALGHLAPLVLAWSLRFAHRRRRRVAASQAK